MNRRLKSCAEKYLTVVLIGLFCFGSSVSVSAAASDSTAYNTYSYYQYDDKKVAVSSPAMYEYEQTYYGSTFDLGPFLNPQDVFCDSDGSLFILDSGNARIVVLNSKGELKKVISELFYENEAISFSGAKGICVDKDNIYIADTENARVIVTDLDGKVLDILTMPQDPTFPKNFQYAPIKLAIDSKGYLYVLSNGSYYGALLYNQQKEFCGFFGSNTVKASIGSVLTNIKNYFFESNEKLSASERALPFSFNDLSISNDFVYTVTGVSASSGQINKFSPGGTNILRTRVADKVKSSSEYDFTDTDKFTGILKRTNKKGTLESDFVSIDIRNNLIYAVDGAYGKIYIFDQNCNFLNVFSGGLEDGKQKGTFVKPSSITVFFDKIYVVDSEKNSVTVFSQTEYGALLTQAQNLCLKGSYIEAKPVWDKVLKLDQGNVFAYRGMAKAAFLERDYKKSMEYSKMAFDRATYAQAFEKVRNSAIQDNIWIVVAAVVGIVTVIAVVLVFLRKKVLVNNIKYKTAVSCMIHPFGSFTDVKYKNQGSVLISCIILMLFYLSTVISKVYSGFAFQIYDPEDFNSLYNLLSSVGVIVLWCIVNWAICSLMQGKGKLNEVFIVTCYALIPQIVMNILHAVLTNILLPSEAGFLDALSIIMIIYTAFLLCVGIMIIHEYDFFNFVGTGIITVLCMFLVVFIVFLIFMLFQQAGNFIATIFKEIISR